MQKFSYSQNIFRLLAPFLFGGALAVLAGCSDNTGSTATVTGGGSASGAVSGVVAFPTIALTLTDPTTSTVVTSISNGTSANVTATLKDASGAAVSNAVVTFTTDTTMATMNPPSGTALTDALGKAVITLTGTVVTGATTITANAQVATTAVTNSIGYAVGAVTVAVTNPLFGVNTAPAAAAPLAAFGTTSAPLSAFGTTSVGVAVSGAGSGAQTVNFSSVCSSSGKAVLSTGITTVGGVAIASYRDNGCASTDVITATVSGGLATGTSSLVVIPPTSGSIQYVSSLPANISLKGIGGVEVSQVTFKVLDTGGNPVSGKTVTFGLSTTVGGITLTPGGTATSDAAGLVVTNVNAGTISTPVRVTASTCSNSTNPCTGTTLTTQSNQLTITTGIPDQFGFSLAATTHNIEGWTHDGTKSVLTARLADHFKNPVPDGTAVVFTAEAGTVVGSCLTLDGNCSATYTSSGTRPNSATNGKGRVTVLAYAVGEETFTDLDGDGWADKAPANELIDPNGNATDLPEAWVDYNENGSYDPATEPYIDYNNNGAYNTADTFFNGVLCKEAGSGGTSSAGTCSANKTLHVRQSQVIVLSTSGANITINGGATAIATTTLGSPALTNVAVPVGTLAVGQVLTGVGIPTGATISSITFPTVTMSANASAAGTGVVINADYSTISPIAIPQCNIVVGNIPATFKVTVVDGNGNAMPAGTTVAFTKDNGVILSDTSYIVPDTIGCRSGYTGCPDSAASATFGDIPVTMKSDATFTVGTPNTCTNSTLSGTFTVKVTSPLGLITTATLGVTD